MAKRIYDKIMAGLDEARAYLDGTADKRRYRVHPARKRRPRRSRLATEMKTSLRRAQSRDIS